MAKSKINKTSPSLSNKSHTAPDAITTEQRKTIGRQVLLAVSAAKIDDCPMLPDGCPGHNQQLGNLFTWRASQVNTDLASAAHCEFEGDIYTEDENFFDLLRSPEYWNLRQTFMEDAEKGDSCALLNVVWRAYNAGLISPERLIPDTKQVRMDRYARQSAGPLG